MNSSKGVGVLRIKYFLIITLTIFCISICYFCLSYYREFRNFAESNVVKELHFEQSFVENSIQYQFRTSMDNILFIGNLPVVREYISNSKKAKKDNKAVLDVINRPQTNNRTVQSIALLDKNGEYLINSSANGMEPLVANYWIKKYVKDAVHEIIQDVNTLDEKEYNGLARSVLLYSSLVPDSHEFVYIYPVFNYGSKKASDFIGFVLAEIPFSSLLANTQLPKYSKSVIELSEKPIYEKQNFISRNGLVHFNNFFGKQLISVWVNIFYPLEDVEEEILDSILIQVRTNVFISSIIGVSLIICFLFILHSFSKLFWYISQIERYKTVQPAKFIIWEFEKTSNLLHRMKSTINQQLKDIEKRNQNLEQANSEIADANRRLERMNNGLEELVNERTISLQNALELSNNCNNISNVIINQRSMLHDTMSSDEIFQVLIKSIKQFNLKRDFELTYRLEGEPEQSYSCIEDEIEDLNSAVEDSYCFENGCYWFPLVLKEGTGNLIIKSPNTSIETDILTNISVFCRDISSFLDNYILRKRISYWAVTDGLTKLGNRVAYDQKIAHYENSLDEEYGLFLIDVNGLKEVNDKKGHTSGDALLKRVAEKLHSVLDKYEASIFRIGGDEYTAIIEAKYLDNSAIIIQELKDAQDDYDTYVKADRIGICATYAIGFADSRRVPAQMMYKIADREMYMQKQEHYERCFKLYGEIRKPRH